MTTFIGSGTYKRSRMEFTAGSQRQFFGDFSLVAGAESTSLGSAKHEGFGMTYVTPWNVGIGFAAGDVVLSGPMTFEGVTGGSKVRESLILKTETMLSFFFADLSYTYTIPTSSVFVTLGLGFSVPDGNVANIKISGPPPVFESIEDTNSDGTTETSNNRSSFLGIGYTISGWDLFVHFRSYQLKYSTMTSWGGTGFDISGPETFEAELQQIWVGGGWAF